MRPFPSTCFEGFHVPMDGSDHPIIDGARCPVATMLLQRHVHLSSTSASWLQWWSSAGLEPVLPIPLTLVTMVSTGCLCAGWA